MFPICFFMKVSQFCCIIEKLHFFSHYHWGVKQWSTQKTPWPPTNRPFFAADAGRGIPSHALCLFLGGGRVYNWFFFQIRSRGVLWSPCIITHRHKVSLKGYRITDEYFVIFFSYILFMVSFTSDQSFYELNCIPPPSQIHMLISHSPAPQNATVFRDRLCKGVI